MVRNSRRRFIECSATAGIMSVTGCLRLQSGGENGGGSSSNSISDVLELTKRWDYPNTGAVKGANGDFYISRTSTQRGLVKVNQAGEVVFVNTDIFESNTWLDFWYWNNALLVDDSDVYIGVQTAPEGDKGARIHRLDSQTGNEVWEYTENSEFKSIMDPLRHGNQILYGKSKNNGESSIHAVDVETGQSLWEFADFNGRITELITLGENLWIQSTASITRYNVSSTEKEESITQIDPQWSLHSKLENGLLYVPSDPIKTVDVESTEVIWAKKSGISIHTDPVIGDSFVIYGTTTGYIYSYDKVTGENLWETRVNGEVGNPMILRENRLWVKTNTGHLYAIDSQTGDILYKKQVVSGDGTRFAFAIQNGIMAIQERYNSEPIKTGGFELPGS